MQLGAAGLDLGEVQDPVHLPQEMLAARVDVLGIGSDAGRVGRLIAIGHQLGEADDRVQRGAELVAHIGEELGLRAVGGLGPQHRGMHDLGVALGFLAGGDQAHLGVVAADQDSQLAGIFGKQRPAAGRRAKIRSHLLSLRSSAGRNGIRLPSPKDDPKKLLTHIVRNG